MSAAFHRSRVDLSKRYAPASDLRLLVPRIAGPGKPVTRQGGDQPGTFVPRELRERPRLGHGGVRQERVGQSDRKVAAHHVCGRSGPSPGKTALPRLRVEFGPLDKYLLGRTTVRPGKHRE